MTKLVKSFFKKPLFIFLAFLTFSLFLSACNCGVEENPSSANSNTSSSISFTSNHAEVYYGEISNYTLLTNLVHYQYYVLSNIHNGTKQTNYYFTNTLTTNNYTNLNASNSYSAHYGDIAGFTPLSNLVKYQYYSLENNQFTLIRDNNQLGYSNYKGVTRITNYYFTNNLMTNTLWY